MTWIWTTAPRVLAPSSREKQMLKTLKWTVATLCGLAAVYYAVSTHYMKSRIVRQKDMISYLNEKNILMRDRLNKVEPASKFEEGI